MSISSSQHRVLAKQEHLIKHLFPNEIDLLENIIEDNCDCLSAAVVQVLHESVHQWRKYACGILCFITDYNKRIYCFRLYDLSLGQSIYEESVSSHLQLQQIHDLFYTFDGAKCKVGINFADRMEAEIFRERFRTKQQHRQRKKQRQAAVPASQTKTDTSKRSLFRTILRKKKPVISGPDDGSFTHTICVTPTQCFVKDESKKQLFEAVLDGMRLSAKDKLYVQRMVESDNGALTKLFTPSINDCDNREQQMIQRPPPIPPRLFIETRTNENPPLSPPNTREVSASPIRPSAPPVPLRPIPVVPTTLHPPKQVVPPPHPPTAATSVPPSTSESGSFLQDIIKFNPSNLKPTPPKVASAPEKVHVDAQCTLVENIQQMILDRRPFIMPVDDNCDYSSDDDE